jgi:hypothetical protein
MKGRPYSLGVGRIFHLKHLRNFHFLIRIFNMEIKCFANTFGIFSKCFMCKVKVQVGDIQKKDASNIMSG